MMPKVRKNHTLGLRCYWSLYNDVTWQKSQRFSAYSIMVFGALLVASGIIFGEIVNMIVMLSSVFIFLIANLIAAHSYYKQEKQKELN